MEKQYFFSHGNKVLWMLLAALTALAGCSDSSDSDSVDNPGLSDESFLAFTASRDAGFTVGRLDRLTVSENGTVSDTFASTQSDYTVATDGEAVYHIGRFGIDSISKYEAEGDGNLVYQRSVAGEEGNANPYEIVFADENKAYIVRYGSTRVWIVDPAATEDEAFKLGELDLSAYADEDGVPEASDAVIVGDKLFILMQRLVNFSPTQSGYLAVFDTTTDEEIDTGAGVGDGLNGIPLAVHNAEQMQYLAADDQLYVLGRGNFFAADDSAGNRYTGGVESVDADTYATSLVLDDGDETTNEGFLTGLQVVSATQAYVITQAGFGDNTLRSLNLLNGELNEAPLTEFQNVDITLLAEDPTGRVWVGVNELPLPGFRVFDPADASLETTKISTELIPQDVAFISPGD